MREILNEIMPKAIAFSNFCQKFKFEYWKKTDNPVAENVLDKLAKIAWDILN